MWWERSTNIETLGSQSYHVLPYNTSQLQKIEICGDVLLSAALKMVCSKIEAFSDTVVLNMSLLLVCNQKEVFT